VDDTKGGKTGKCPKCQTQFQIPMPEGAPAPAAVGSGPAPTLPPPSADPNAPVEIAPCPGCQARLSVATSDLGADVECPYCKTVYKAKKPGTGTSPVSPSRRSELDEDRPSRRRRDEEEEEDDRPSRRRRRDEVDEEEEEDDRPRRRRRDEEEEEDRPRKRKRRRGGSYAPHRGVTILIFGILGWAVCLIFGIMAWVMGNADIKAMDEGRMDPEGRGMTQIGRIMGMVQCILALICVPVYIGLIFLGALGGK
jgi:phage FluMu protein Com